MRVLIAGGAGFIGSHLAARLLADRHDVVVVDNLVTGSRSNLEALEGRAGFRFVLGNIVEPLDDARIGLVDRVYHLASPASPEGYCRHPVATMRANSEGTRHLLDLARRHDARFLFSSTSEVYGDPLVHPQREDYRGNVSSLGPRSMYDEAKRFAEALIRVYTNGGSVDARIVRIFNTYGPHLAPDDGRVVSNFIRQALLGEPMTLYGDGAQTRSLCYVSDLVDGLVRAMERDGIAGEVVNLGNPEEHTIVEFAEMIRDLTGSRSELIFTDYRVGDDPQRRCPDIDKARELLKWGPEVGLRDGLSRTIEWFRSVVQQKAA